MNLFSVGIPARNEAENIFSLVNTLLSFENLHHILICINGSIDKTEEIVQNIKNEKIKILTSNPGKGNALFSIINQCETNLLIMMDADCQITQKSYQQICDDLKTNQLVAGNVSFGINNLGFFSRTFLYGIPDFRSFKLETGLGNPNYIIGCLYAFHTTEFKNILKKNELENALKSIINEDLLISILYHNENIPIYLSPSIVAQKGTAANRIYEKIKRISAGNRQVKKLGLSTYYNPINFKLLNKYISTEFSFLKLHHLFIYLVRALFLASLYKIASIDLWFNKDQYSTGWKKIN